VRTRRQSRLVLYRVSLLSTYTALLLRERENAALVSHARAFAHVAAEISEEIVHELASDLVVSLAASGALAAPKPAQDISPSRPRRSQAKATEATKQAAARHIQARVRGKIHRERKRRERKGLPDALLAIFRQSNKGAQRQGLTRVLTGFGSSNNIGVVQQRRQLFAAVDSHGEMTPTATSKGGRALGEGSRSANGKRGVPKTGSAQRHGDGGSGEDRGSTPGEERAAAATLIASRYRRWTAVRQRTRSRGAAVVMQRGTRRFLAKKTWHAHAAADAVTSTDLTLPISQIAPKRVVPKRGELGGCWRDMLLWLQARQERMALLRREWVERRCEKQHETRLARQRTVERRREATRAKTAERRRKVRDRTASVWRKQREEAEERAHREERRFKVLRAVAELALERAALDEAALERAVAPGGVGGVDERLGRTAAQTASIGRGPRGGDGSKARGAGGAEGGYDVAVGGGVGIGGQGGAIEKALEHLLCSADVWDQSLGQKSVPTRALYLLERERALREERPLITPSATLPVIRKLTLGERSRWEARLEQYLEWLIAWPGEQANGRLATRSSAKLAHGKASSKVVTEGRVRLDLLLEMVDEAVVEQQQQQQQQQQQGTGCRQHSHSCSSQAKAAHTCTHTYLCATATHSARGAPCAATMPSHPTSATHSAGSLNLNLQRSTQLQRSISGRCWTTGHARGTSSVQASIGPIQSSSSTRQHPIDAAGGASSMAISGLDASVPLRATPSLHRAPTIQSSWSSRQHSANEFTPSPSCRQANQVSPGLVMV